MVIRPRVFYFCMVGFMFILGLDSRYRCIDLLYGYNLHVVFSFVWTSTFPFSILPGSGDESSSFFVGIFPPTLHLFWISFLSLYRVSEFYLNVDGQAACPFPWVHSHHYFVWPYFWWVLFLSDYLFILVYVYVPIWWCALGIVGCLPVLSWAVLMGEFFASELFLKCMNHI